MAIYLTVSKNAHWSVSGRRIDVVRPTGLSINRFLNKGLDVFRCERSGIACETGFVRRGLRNQNLLRSRWRGRVSGSGGKGCVILDLRCQGRIRGGVVQVGV